MKFVIMDYITNSMSMFGSYQENEMKRKKGKKSLVFRYIYIFFLLKKNLGCICM